MFTREENSCVRLRVNQLIKWTNMEAGVGSASRVERLLFIDETGTDVAAIDVDAKRSTQPVWHKYSDLKDSIESGEACVLRTDHRRPLALTADDLAKPKNRKRCHVRDKRWEVIEPLVTGENAFKIL